MGTGVLCAVATWPAVLPDQITLTLPFINLLVAVHSPSSQVTQLNSFQYWPIANNSHTVCFSLMLAFSQLILHSALCKL